MPDDVFRIVITVAVVIAAIAFVAQGGILVAMYLLVRKTHQRLLSLADRAEPVIEKTGPVLERLGPVIERLEPAIQKAVPLFEKAGTMVGTLQQVLEENRPKIVEFTSEAVAVAKRTRQQVEHIGDVVSEASERARYRVEQIDQSVENTVEQVELVGDSVKRAVMRPVREANGLAAGVSAVISTLVRGRKYPVHAATQDEEMFI